MKARYRGYEISVNREKCLGDYSMLYYSILRLSDSKEMLALREDSEETVHSMMIYLKELIDAEHKTDDPWIEKEEGL